MSSTAVLPTVQINVNYNEIKTQVRDFFTHFKASSDAMDVESSTGFKYLDLFQHIANRDATTLYIELDDIKAYQENQFFSSQPLSADLVVQIAKNAYHYLELFSSVVDELMPEPTKDISFKDDVLDVILHQRKLRNLRVSQENADEVNNLRSGFSQNEDTQNSDPGDLLTTNLFPAKLTRRYHLYFKPLSSHQKALAVREVKGSHVGKYITVRGIVTRVSDVKPSVLVNAYTCDKCGYEIFQEVNLKVFQPFTECTSEVCKTDNQRGQLFMSTRASRFLLFQEVKIQEMASQVPVGHIPRTLTMHVNGDLVRSMNPGDIVDASGIFLPSPYTGFKALRAGLLTETYLEVQYVHQHKKQYELLELSDEVKEKIEALHREGGIYNKLALSIAPEIYGHLDVKRILLLLLCGGVTKEMGDGMRIRGDINVCLMGDPGVAKSQLLKAINKIAPRSVYTTGRGSSGVGLTAAVMRDPVTDEMVLEGGALVLADNGICCIDEFDKMEEGDRTAIHEVMEQQTISISKAGINTTLNARTSILAAANPLYGRYNPRLSPHENINLPAALLSRFDIMFLMLDQASVESDEQLARHVAYVHMHNHQPEMDFEPLDSQTIRQYISVARTYRPVVPKEVGDYVVQAYINMRKEAHRNEGSIKKFAHITPRTLLGILRLSQALARIRFDNVVSRTDVDEALRLLAVSKLSMESRDVERDDYTSAILMLIRRIIAEGDTNTVNMFELRNRVLGQGYTVEQMDLCIREYISLNVFQLVDNGETLLVVNSV
ncbi:CIC11C00000001767 [Sungouiella intermedia]|uniref:DNA replication licensing factor MCM7 n=1 Tax=Sungouiella intermedia TaxID=45354 RepID=A0A1L0BT50_9ASCO|nr:CIC11C00000001767 [[Candida] intermedia]